MEFLSPGFRFFPTEEELVSFYLNNKLEGRMEENLNQVIPVLDIYEFNPWDLPQFSGELCKNDPEQWFFFIPRQESEARGGRPRRLTTTGYWKATGTPNYVYSSNNRVIGVKRTMVFYTGRAPSGRKTEWKMNEYKAIEGEFSPSTVATPQLRQEFSLCRVYKKSKCLRAFDRRPRPQDTAIIGNPSTQQPPGGDQAPPNPPVMATERTSSPDSSSSGDQHGHRSKTGETSSMNFDMSVDNMCLWEWDQL